MSEKIRGPLTIVQMTAQNVTNLKAVRITPDKNMIVLSGANEAGKSNVLDVIQSMLEGLKLKIPIRDGEDRADATLDLGDIKIRKRWTPKGEALEVYKVLEDGKRQTFSSPQTFLNELTGKMVDPLKLFVLLRDDPKKFRDVLAKLVGLDMTDLKNEEAAIRDERKLVNDRIRASIAQITEMAAPDPETPDEELTFREKLNDLNRIKEKLQIFEKAERDVAAILQSLADHRARIAEIDSEVERLKAEKEQIENCKITQLEKSSVEKTKNMPEKITADQILEAESDIESIEELNKTIRHAIRYRKAVKEAERAKVESEKLTTKLERIEQDKQTRIGACKFPVDGLSLTEDLVIYDGKPLDVASSGRKIRVFVKMAMAMSPTIKVLLVRDGSLLDSTGFNELCDIAESGGFQVWLERTDESGEVGIFIEDGEVTAINGQKVKNETEPESKKTDGDDFISDGEPAS